jgi:hypothetical protein
VHGKSAEPPTYPRAFSAHYAPLTAPALDGIASERFAGTGSDGGCRTLLAEVPAGRMPFPKGWPRAASGVTAAFGRPGAEAPLMGSRGACAETSGASAPWIWTAGISPLLREAGRSNPPVARHCGSGDVPAVRRSEVEMSGRAGGARPCHYTCGLPLGPSPAGAVLLVETRGHLAVGRTALRKTKQSTD